VKTGGFLGISLFCRTKAATPGGVAIACLFCLCRNPFFPDIGLPDKSPPLRKTPAGVITQLINSYEQRRLDLFEDLLPAAGTFRFYVSPSFQSAYVNEAKFYVNPPESSRDTLLQYIGNAAYYYYWTQEVELSSHKSLFAQAQSIVCENKPLVSTIRYIVNDTGDTVNAEVVIEGGEIDAVFDMGGGTSDEEIIEIDKQVFLLERDADKLWVIRKWYDFGSQP
jgi:hypothetical protein